jgi:hypothetical protein
MGVASTSAIGSPRSTTAITGSQRACTRPSGPWKRPVRYARIAAASNGRTATCRESFTSRPTDPRPATASDVMSR